MPKDLQARRAELLVELRELDLDIARQAIMLKYDCDRLGPPAIEVWGKYCWKKGEAYMGPFSFYSELHDGLAVMYQVGKDRPTPYSEGYWGDWSGANRCDAEIKAINDEAYPEGDLK